MSQGKQANRSGKAFENQIKSLLENKEFTVMNYKVWKKSVDQNFPRVLVTQVPYTSIYGHESKSEFLLIAEDKNLEVRIECKWQQTGGSVDEKFPYLLLNCLEAMPQNQIFIITGGGGAKPGAISWLEKAVKERLYTNLSPTQKTITVMTLEKFLIWANSTFR